MAYIGLGLYTSTSRRVALRARFVVRLDKEDAVLSCGMATCGLRHGQGKARICAMNTSSGVRAGR